MKLIKIIILVAFTIVTVSTYGSTDLIDAKLVSRVEIIPAGDSYLEFIDDNGCLWGGRAKSVKGYRVRVMLATKKCRGVQEKVSGYVIDAKNGYAGMVVHCEGIDQIVEGVIANCLKPHLAPTNVTIVETFK